MENRIIGRLISIILCMTCCLSCDNDDELFGSEYGGAIYTVDIHISNRIGELSPVSQITVEAYDYCNYVPLHDNLRKEMIYSSYEGPLTQAISFTTESKVNFFKVQAFLFAVDPRASADLNYTILKDSYQIASGTFKLSPKTPFYFFRSYIPLLEE